MTENTSTAAVPPRAGKRPVETTHHGVTLVDDYAWLRADNWQEVMRDPSVLDPEIRAFLEAENAYMDAAMAETKPLQETLFQEMKARIKEDDSSVPSPDGPWEYYSTTITGGQYPRICRRPRGGGAESIMIDGNKEAEGKPYWSLGAMAHSHDHKLLAYSVDDKGSELYTVRFRDMATGYGSHRRDRGNARRDRLGARQRHRVLCPPGREPSADVRLAPRRRHAG